MKDLFKRYLGWLLTIPILIAGGYLHRVWNTDAALWLTGGLCLITMWTYNYIVPWLSERRGRKSGTGGPEQRQPSRHRD